LIPGSSLWTRPNTSPLASLVGSHQPLPPWLTIRISPLPRRYLRLSFVLSFRSSFHGGGVRSSTTAICTLLRSSPISGSRMVSPLVLGFSSPLPCPATARRPRCKGARNVLEPRDNPCSAVVASGSHPSLLHFPGSRTMARTGNARRLRE